jgi:hypothetical protein
MNVVFVCAVTQSHTGDSGAIEYDTLSGDGLYERCSGRVERQGPLAW